MTSGEVSRLAADAIALAPCEMVDERFVVACARAGALAVVELGEGRAHELAVIERAAKRSPRPIAVRVRTSERVELPENVGVVVVARPALVEAWKGAGRPIVAQVVSVEDAELAIASGAAGLIAKGNEAGGRVGDEATFILLQQLVRMTDLPVWAQGGIGLHTAAGCVVGGARGVVLDSQLALCRESPLPTETKAAIAAMDGSETTIVHGHRVFTRPDLKVTSASEEETIGLIGPALRTNLVPLGQDAAFAKSLAARFVTAGGIITAVREAIASHIEAAKRLAPLAPSSPLAAAHGARYPIAQGPMTRVSDRAAFAEAVAKGGGLPFLALSLLREAQVRELMIETRDRLGDLPWGVGVLGFVPAELREEQLRVIAEIKPPLAIIAGGRPSQARPLEAQGTPTYLHVPSPGLLDLFLKDGARKFIFEGRECGGHVGPRSSFALWEAQIERLLEEPKLEEVHVLFAGGVHDGVSAAMVAAIAAPLAERGAKVGVLMGTAYLFTHEAVSSGAILPAFQDEAMKCKRTSLLETAPGHATRCVETDFVRAFRAERERLEREGVDGKAIWMALEQLNLGRLRIASKGLVRQDDGSLIEVDEATQRRDGMYMIGQVATLRHERCSIEELHEGVSGGSVRHLARIAVPKIEERDERNHPVAIVGMACIYPGAPELADFWANIVSGVDSVTEVPRERWNPDIYYDGSSMSGDKTPSKWGGFVPKIAFDPLSFGIPPKSLASIEPTQLLSLEVARRALDDAGYSTRPFRRDRASVIFGAESGTDLSGAYGFRSLFPMYAGELPAALDERLPTLTEDSFPGVLANVIAGRIANRLDLGGVNYTVDAACAASLAAVDLAMKELENGVSDMVLCGGADLHNSIADYLMFASVHALSRKGRCATFDAAADGIALGEGIACVVLKRLEDAERDGDRVYAVIRGIAGSSDGRSLGLTAPRKEGQMRALERAYRRAGMSPKDIGLVEAHGTGTVVGDRTEMATLSEVYRAAGVETASCTLGSVKSQIGHTKCAAGLAGLIKAALALHHRVLPPTLHVEKPNPGYDAATSPFVLSGVARPWPSEKRAAAVSAFGFGGTNFHAVLEAYEPETVTPNATSCWDAELFLFRGASLDEAKATAAQLASIVANDDSLRLRDLAKTISMRGSSDGARLPGEPSGGAQFAIVARSIEHLKEALDALAKGSKHDSLFVDSGSERGKVAFLFPGQGSQRPGMLAELFVRFPWLQRHLGPGVHLLPKMFPGGAFTPDDKAAQLAAITDTRVAQPTLGMADLAANELLQALGVRPEMTAGHSYGELVALTVAGALDESELVALSEARAHAILGAAGEDKGAMAAVSGNAADVEKLIAGIDGVVIANENSPRQTVISGTTPGITLAIAALEKAGVTARAIQVACAFHSPVVAKGSETFGARLSSATVRAPSLTVYSNTSAEPYPIDPDAIRARMAEQIAKPVRFATELERMYEAGARVFVEVGPGRVLTALARAVLDKKPHVSVAIDQSGKAGLATLLEAVATLAVHGIAIDARALFAGRDAETLDLQKPRSRKPGKGAWLVNGHLARPITGELPKGALRPVEEPIVTLVKNGTNGASERPHAGAHMTREIAVPSTSTHVHASHDAHVAPAADVAVVEFLRNMREVVQAQRDVMLGYLGTVGSSDQLAEVAARPRVLIEAPPRAIAREAAPVNGAPHHPAGNGATARRGATARTALPVAPSKPESQAPEAIVQSVENALLDIVSAKTGYPIEMLGLDLDLEAELSIDSIKRVEILGALGARLGFSEGSTENRDQIIEELAARKTLRGIVEWLDAKGLGGRGKEPKTAGTKAPTAAPDGGEAEPPVVPSPGSSGPIAISQLGQAALRRFVTRVERANEVVLHNSLELKGRAFAIAGDGRGVADYIVKLLETQGATARRLADGEQVGKVDGVIHLRALDVDGPEPAKDLFLVAQSAVLEGASWVLGVTGLGGAFGHGEIRGGTARSCGIAGLLKSLAKERTDVRVRAVDVSLEDDPEEIAEEIIAELLASDSLVEVGYQRGVRRSIRVTRSDVDVAPKLELDKDAVVLVTGGARGITAHAAIALAFAHRCRIVMVGRSALPDSEEPIDLAAAADLPALRKALLARGSHREPRLIEAEAKRILAEREIRATLRSIEASGATAEYRALDVRDEGAFEALIDELYAKHGRLDGVVHGAGVIEDKLLRQKTSDSFARVFDTKVVPARVLLRKLKRETKFVAFFGSVSGAFGNRGQIDYAAANDALDKIALELRDKIAGRVVTIAWGPWAGTGMVSVELERAYEKQGIGLIPLDAGVALLLQEIAGPGDSSVIAMCAEPAAFKEAPAAQLVASA